jgi:hypothetical protein
MLFQNYKNIHAQGLEITVATDRQGGVHIP